MTERAPAKQLRARRDLEPVPRHGCKVCAALVAERQAARKAGNFETVRSLNAELQNHPHERAGDRK